MAVSGNVTGGGLGGAEETLWDGKSGSCQQQRGGWEQCQEGRAASGHLKEGKAVYKPGGCRPVIRT